MKVTIKSFRPVAAWKWETSNEPFKPYLYGNGGIMDDDEDDDVCGICMLAYESCCPSCRMPGDDCPLIWGECTHVFHMHCLLKWIDTESSKGQCPLDRRPWVTADRKPDKLSTTVDGAPMASAPPGPIVMVEEDEDQSMYDEEVEGATQQSEMAAGTAQQ